MNSFSLPLLILTAIVASAASATAKAEKSHALRHSEEVSDGVKLPVPSGMMQEEMMVGSMGSAIQSEAQEVMDAKSPKAKLQRKLVSLIWLERVLQQNLASIDEEAFADKIAKSKSGLEKDTTPATAKMLTNMRTEMYEFSAPFFQKAVKEELEDIRARQQKLLKKITAIDDGEDVDDDEDDEDEDADDEAEEPEKKKKKEKKDKKKKKSVADQEADAAAKAELKRAKNAQSNLFVGLMALICGILILIVVGVAIKVNLHIRSRGETA